MPYKIQLETVANTQALDKVVKGLEQSTEAADDAAKSLTKVGKAAADADQNLGKTTESTKDQAEELDKVAASAEKAASKIKTLSEAELLARHNAPLLPGNPGESAAAAAQRIEAERAARAAAPPSSSGPHWITEAQLLAQHNAPLETGNPTPDPANNGAQPAPAAPAQSGGDQSDVLTNALGLASLHDMLNVSALRLGIWGAVAGAVAKTATLAFEGFKEQNPSVGESMSKLAQVAKTELGQKLTTVVETVFGANAVSKLEKFAEKMLGPVEHLKAMAKAAATFKQENIADELHKAALAMEKWNDQNAHRQEWESNEIENASKLRKEMLEDEKDEIDQSDAPESEKMRRKRAAERSAGYDELDLREADRRVKEAAAEAAVKRQAEEAAQRQIEVQTAKDIFDRRTNVVATEAQLKEAEAKSPSARRDAEVARLEAIIKKLRDEMQGLYKTLPEGHSNDLFAIDTAQADKQINPGGNGLTIEEADKKRGEIYAKLLEEAKKAREELDKQQRELEQLKQRNTQANANDRGIFENQNARADRQTERQAGQAEAEEGIAEAQTTLGKVESSVTEDAKKLTEGLRAMEAKKRATNAEQADAIAKLAASIEDGIAPGEIEKVQRALSNMGGEVSNGFSAMAGAMFTITRSLEGNVSQMNQLKSRIDALEASSNAAR